MNREALAHRCNRIDLAGGSVREYLHGLGCISPWGTWFRLQLEELHRPRYQITDGRGCDEMRKITLADKKKAVDIALNGGNPLVFLKEIGSKQPSALWYAIKKTLKETDPETYEQLAGPKEEEAEPAQEKPEEILPENDPGEAAADDYGYRAFVKEEKLRAVRPVNYGGFDVMALKDPETGDSFVWDDKHGRMDWRNCVGEEVSMTPEAWHKLIKTLPQIMEIFGI